MPLRIPTRETSADDDSNGHVALPWYALKVHTRSEPSVASLLAGKGYEAFLPSMRESRRYSDRMKVVDAPLFPGYLFCRLDTEHRLPVLTTPGVDYIVSIDRVPEPIPEPEVDAIRSIVDSGSPARPWPYLKAGDRVVVTFGALSNLEGILVRDKGVDRLVVSVTLLERSVATEIDRSWVRPIS